MSRRLVVVGFLLTLMVAACGGGDDGENTAATPTGGATPEPTPCAIQDGSTEAQESGTSPPTSPVTDVRYSPARGEGGCPRIVFEFEDTVPAYQVEYATGPFSECGSGEDVPTDSWGAGAFLTVRLEPSGSADLSKPDAPQTYDGPRDIDIGGKVLKHMKVTCDFEAVFSWVVGLDARHDFSVFTLDDPSRVVIDISEIEAG